MEVIILKVEGRKLKRKVERKENGFEMEINGGDIMVGKLIRMKIVLNRGVLRRNEEGVKENGMKKVEKIGEIVERKEIENRIIEKMENMDEKRRIGENIKKIIFIEDVDIVGLKSKVLLKEFMKMRLRKERIIKLGWNESI